MRHYSKGATSIDALITDTDSGGFTAVASTGTLDRDGEIVAPGAFAPLPDSIPVHLDHDMRAANVIARARPYYVGDRLMIDATFGSDEHAQSARRKVAEGMVDSVSIVFLPSMKREIKGVPTVLAGSLLACDVVSIPSNSEARILSSRSFDLPRHAATSYARRAALLALVDVELDEARRTLKSARREEVSRTKSEIRAFLRSL